MFVDLRSKIYYITPDPREDTARLVAEVREVLRAGVGMVQYRAKETTARHMYEQVVALLRVTRPARTPLIVNDRTEVALAAGADGVHVGEEDLPVNVARRLMGPHAIVGASVNGPERAREAERAGASYVGCGAVFPTETKAGQQVVGVEGVRAVMEAVTIPVCAIGGINAETLPHLQEANPELVAVISAIGGAEDPGVAARELVRLSAEWLPHRRPRA